MFNNRISALILLSLSACGSSTTATTTAAATSSTSTLTISSSFSCTKTSGGLLFGFNGVTYSTGDAWVSCEVSNTSTQGSSSKFYRSSQPGSGTFYCSVALDAEAPNSAGFWSFRSSTSKTAVYTDSGAVLNNTTVTFASSDCTTN